MMRLKVMLVCGFLAMGYGLWWHHYGWIWGGAAVLIASLWLGEEKQ